MPAFCMQFIDCSGLHAAVCAAQVYRRECMVQELILELDVKWVGKQKFQLQARSSISYLLRACLVWTGNEYVQCGCAAGVEQWVGGLACCRACCKVRLLRHLQQHRMYYLE